MQFHLCFPTRLAFPFSPTITLLIPYNLIPYSQRNAGHGMTMSRMKSGTGLTLPSSSFSLQLICFSYERRTKSDLLLPQQRKEMWEEKQGNKSWGMKHVKDERMDILNENISLLKGDRRQERRTRRSSLGGKDVRGNIVYWSKPSRNYFRPTFMPTHQSSELNCYEIVKEKTLTRTFAGNDGWRMLFREDW